MISLFLLDYEFLAITDFVALQMIPFFEIIDAYMVLVSDFVNVSPFLQCVFEF